MDIRNAFVELTRIYQVPGGKAEKRPFRVNLEHLEWYDMEMVCVNQRQYTVAESIHEIEQKILMAQGRLITAEGFTYPCT